MKHASFSASLLPYLKRPRTQTLMLFTLCMVQFLLFLGNRDLWFPDEPDVAEPVREMLLRGDWVVPTLNGHWWIDYPPMVYWLGMIVCKLSGGVTEWTLRLPSALAATALVLAVFRFVSVRFSPTTGICAGLVLATCPQFAWNAVNVNVDMIFACFQGIGLFTCLAAWDRSGWRARALSLLGFLCFGIAFLAKGPLGLLLPGLVLSLWLLSYRQWRRWLALAPLALCTLAMVLPWYVGLGERIGHWNVWHEFWAQNFARFASGERGHLQPWYYFFTRIWADLGLWTIPLITVMIMKWRDLWNDRWQRFALLWFFGLFMFFSIATTKREVYLLPAYPSVAIIVGIWLGRCLDYGSESPDRVEYTGVLRILAVLVSAFGLVIAAGATIALFCMPYIAGRFFGNAPEHAAVAFSLRPSLLVSACTGLLVTAISLTGLRLRSPGLQVSSILGLHIGAWLVSVSMILPAFDPVKSYRPRSEWLLTRMAPGAELGYYYPGRMKYTGFLFYTRAPMRILDTADDLLAFLDTDPRQLAVAGEVPGRIVAADPRFATHLLDRFRVGSTGWMVFGGHAQKPATSGQ